MEATHPCSSLLEVTSTAPQEPTWYCEQLEQGRVLFFPTVPFDFSERDRQFLLSLRQTASRFHKNISYRATTGVLKGLSADSGDRARLHRVMQDFSREVARFVGDILAPYAGHLKLDFASFRPLQEQGRNLSLHQRNDLLHVDAFPSRPTHGARILRVFVNINVATSRVWNVGQPFHALVPGIIQNERIGPPRRSDTARVMARWLARLGLPVRDRSPYDDFMLFLHDWMKENADFQKKSAKREISFPPGSCWMVYTDGVPHAVLSGQFALEQTFIVPVPALVSPQAAPINVLESATGRAMAN